MAVIVVFVVTLIIFAECQHVTEEAVKKIKTSKNEVSTVVSPYQLARENVLKNGKVVRCALPKPKVIKVQDVHPHAFKRFVPSCIVLHRCGKDAGCCDDPLSTCAYSKKRRVTLHFYVVSLGTDGRGPAVTSDGKVEALSFVNHTQCVCRRRRKVFVNPHQQSTVSKVPRVVMSDFVLILCIVFIISVMSFR